MNEESHEYNILTKGRANDYYRIGVEFRDAAFRCLGNQEGDEFHLMKDGDFCILPSASVVNAAFACEIILKALLIRFQISFPNKHDLDLLFRLLPESVKKDISWFCLKTDISGFEVFLRKHSRDFKDARYYVENRGWYGMDPIKIISLSFYLSQVAKIYIEE